MGAVNLEAVKVSEKFGIPPLRSSTRRNDFWNSSKTQVGYGKNMNPASIAGSIFSHRRRIHAGRSANSVSPAKY